MLTEGTGNKKGVETNAQWLPHKLGQAKVPKVEKQDKPGKLIVDRCSKTQLSCPPPQPIN